MSAKRPARFMPAEALDAIPPAGRQPLSAASEAKTTANRRSGIESSRDSASFRVWPIAFPRAAACHMPSGRAKSQAAKVAEIREFSTDSDFAVAVGRHLVRYRNTDSLVSKADWNIVVQKTGYIHRAGRCLVMQTVIEDRPVVIVLLNSFGKRTRVADARRVRRWVEATMVAHDTATATAATT